MERVAKNLKLLRTLTASDWKPRLGYVWYVLEVYPLLSLPLLFKVATFVFSFEFWEYLRLNRGDPAAQSPHWERSSWSFFESKNLRISYRFSEKNSEKKKHLLSSWRLCLEALQSESLRRSDCKRHWMQLRPTIWIIWPFVFCPQIAGSYRGSYFRPQIAGSYRGSYFSMTGLLISEIATWSWCRCRLVSQACLPSWFPFWGCSWLPLLPCLPACLPSWFPFWGCSWLPLPPCLPAVSLHDFPSGAALGCPCRLVSQLVSLHDFPSGAALGCPCRLVSQLVFLHDFPSGAALGCPCSQLVSLHDFPAGPALGCPCRLVSQLVSLHDFPSGACSWLPLPPCLPAWGCSWLALPPCLPACLPSWFPFWGCSWLPLPPCLPACLPSWLPFWGCSWLPLPPCLPACFPPWFPLPACFPPWFPFRGCSCLPLPPCLPSLSPFMIFFYLITPKAVFLLDSPVQPLFSFSWLQLPPCLASFSPPWFPFWAALGYSRLVSQACLLSFWAALRLPPCFPSLSSFFLLGCCWQLSPCLPVLSSFSPLWSCIFGFYVCISRLVSHALLAYRTQFLPLYPCYWFISRSIDPLLLAIFCNLCGMMLSGVYASVILSFENEHWGLRHFGCFFVLHFFFIRTIYLL